MNYWARLFLELDKEALIAGANSMLEIAVKLLDKKKVRLTLEEKNDPQDG
jgi:hypothetical protein